jgi:hypothetical protein
MQDCLVAYHVDDPSPDQPASVVPEFILGSSAAINGKSRRLIEVLGGDLKHESREVRHLLRRWVKVEGSAASADVRADEPGAFPLDVLRLAAKEDTPDPGNRLGLATGDAEPEGCEMRTRNAGESLLPRCRKGIACRSGDGTPRSNQTLVLPGRRPWVERIGEFWSYPQSRTFAELLIDCEEDETRRAVLVGIVREMERK